MQTILKITLLVLFVSIKIDTMAQSPIVTELWAEHPSLHQIDSKYLAESAVVIYDLRRMEFIDEKDGLTAFKTLHKIVRVNDDKGIESFNKVYLGVSDNADIVNIKARTILPNGKIIELDRNNIKDLKDEEGDMYKIFALEGLVKGCEIEYVYTYKRPATFFLREIIQNEIPQLNVKMEVISPKRLAFDFRAYNAPNIAAQQDTSLSEDKRTISISQMNIPGAEEEKYSNVKANLQRVEFKLSYNLSRSNSERLFTWNELARRIFEIYNTINEKETKKVAEFIEKNEWNKLASEKEKIISIENYIKKTFTAREDIDNEEAENIEKILKNKIASHRGIIRLYASLFQQLGVNYQIVMAGDRSGFTVDKNFENWNSPENALFYFTGTKKFMAPTRLEMRYPWIYPDWGATNGLFSKGTTIGNFNTAVGEVKMIPLEDYKQTANNIEANVSLTSTMDSMLVDIRQLYTGYSAAVYRASFIFSSADEKKQMLKDLVKFGTNSENILNSKLENVEFENYSDNKPFVLQALVKASELVEKAGNKILVKIGDIIGPQVEMYQDKPRQFPMEIPYPHVLERFINFTIPDGYQVKNLEELNINHIYPDADSQTMGFVSTYTLEGNLLRIHIVEDYRLVAYPVSLYEDFRKIINAAADFNKIVLLLEKKL